MSVRNLDRLFAPRSVALIDASRLERSIIGGLMMRELIAYARARGIGALVGDVLAENATMLALARDLGFTVETEDSGAVRVTLPLTLPAGSGPSADRP